MVVSNELVFLTSIGALVFSLLYALRLGVESLYAVTSLLWVLANLFVTKCIILFGLHATASDALAVGAILGLNLIQEYFGKEKAKISIITNFLCMGLYTALSVFHCAYLPGSGDLMHGHFVQILSPMPRILIASCLVYAFVQCLDLVIYNRLLKAFHGRFFIARNILSMSITQTIDTVLFTLFALYGTHENLGHIIIISLTIKLITLLLATPFLALSRMFMKTRRW